MAAQGRYLMHGNFTPQKSTKGSNFSQSEVKSRGLQSVAYSKTSEKSESILKKLNPEEEKQLEDSRSKLSKSEISQNFERRRDRL